MKCFLYRNQPIAPFCDFLNNPVNPSSLSCNVDRTAVAFCNLINWKGLVVIPQEYQVGIYA